MPIAFVILVGALIVIAALMTVTRRNPSHAALCMVVALGGVAVLMVGLRSPFLAAMQILLYGGAIMVLFTFVIMLLTLKEEEMGPEPGRGAVGLALIVSFGMLTVLWYAIAQRGGGGFHLPNPGGGAGPDDFGSVQHFARFLYTDYVVAFELITVLVMAAVAGVIVLARRPSQLTVDGSKLVARSADGERGEGAA